VEFYVESTEQRLAGEEVAGLASGPVKAKGAWG